VTTQKLDDLMNQIGEILVTRIKFDEASGDSPDRAPDRAAAASLTAVRRARLRGEA
jgi:hypothetical protein